MGSLSVGKCAVIPAGTRAIVTISPPRPPSSSLRLRLASETAALLDMPACLLEEVYVRLHQTLLCCTGGNWSALKLHSQGALPAEGAVDAAKCLYVVKTRKLLQIQWQCHT